MLFNVPTWYPFRTKEIDVCIWIISLIVIKTNFHLLECLHEQCEGVKLKMSGSGGWAVFPWSIRFFRDSTRLILLSPPVKKEWERYIKERNTERGRGGFGEGVTYPLVSSWWRINDTDRKWLRERELERLCVCVCVVVWLCVCVVVCLCENDWEREREREREIEICWFSYTYRI